MTASAAPVHDRLALLADPTRGRILLVLSHHELTVSEICAVLALPQSTVSRHLRVLADEGWVTMRQEGTSRFYSRTADLDEASSRLWALVAEDLQDGDAWRADQSRLAGVLSQRRATSKAFFDGAGPAWDDLRQELFGGTSGGALLGLLDETIVIGDLGCGAGHVTATLAPWVGKVIGVDASSEMLNQARARLGAAGNVDLRIGELEALPVDDGELDAAVLSLVLHHAADPPRVLAEARRALRPRGRMLLMDLQPHARQEYRQQMGHVWLGFSEDQVRNWLREAGYTSIRIRAMPADPDAKGPGLFVATGVTPGRVISA
jgi:ArsR family transcriptional regulator